MIAIRLLYQDKQFSDCYINTNSIPFYLSTGMNSFFVRDGQSLDGRICYKYVDTTHVSPEQWHNIIDLPIMDYGMYTIDYMERGKE